MVPEPEPVAGASRILIVEDHPLVRTFLAESLRDAGFIVVEAANAEEALVYVGAANPIDLVISDIRMPGPLDGIALVQQLKSTHPSLPAILTSAYFEPRNIKDLALFIQKPYRQAEIMGHVVQILGLRPSNESEK